MKINLSLLLLFFSTIVHAQYSDLKLIAHRGGVVDSATPENSKLSLRKAAERGYWMVEIDVRLTKDSVLITQHDPNFKRYFNLDREVKDMKWDQIENLKSDQGTSVNKLEYVLRFCAKHNLNVMLDNKIKGFHLYAFEEIIRLLDKYGLRQDALMIGTSGSTEYFTGKVRLSCNMEQLIGNMARLDYSSSNYYLFANPSKDEMDWAIKNNIMVVGIINDFSKNRNEKDTLLKGKEIADHLKSIGVHFIQLDSKFDRFFFTLN